MKKTELYRTHLFEVYVFEYDGAEYETTIDATEQRFRKETHNLSGGSEIPDEVYDYIDAEILKMNQ